MTNLCPLNHLLCLFSLLLHLALISAYTLLNSHYMLYSLSQQLVLFLFLIPGLPTHDILPCNAMQCNAIPIGYIIIFLQKSIHEGICWHYMKSNKYLSISNLTLRATPRIKSKDTLHLYLAPSSLSMLVVRRSNRSVVRLVIWKEC